MIEQLCSLLVAALAFLILTGALASCASVDAKTRKSLSERGVLELIPDSVSTPTLSLRLVGSDGAAIVSSVSMNWLKVDGKNLYHYDGP